MSSRARTHAILLLALALALAVAVSAVVPRATTDVQVQGLAHIQRTLRLLQTRAAPHPRVRVLFYGQSITESRWWKDVAVGLRQRFPHANLEIENRALGGFAAQQLVRTAETDVVPFYPDLVIFHAYGNHYRYRDLMGLIREQTTAEVLVQNDHVTSLAAFEEERDPRRLEPSGPSFTAFMNHRFLPGLVTPYAVALCDEREAWKAHLRATGRSPDDLLSDGLHPNEAGRVLMASLVQGCLRRVPRLSSPADGWVRTQRVDAGEQGTWELDFTGNRVDLITRPAAYGRIAAHIDGQPPCALPGARVFTRALSPEAGRWPALLGLKSRAPLLVETFTLDVRVQRGAAADAPLYAFTLRGSRTGQDGEGRSDQAFVSRSGRVVIEPEAWEAARAFEMVKQPLPSRFQIRFSVEEHCRDSVRPTASDPSREHASTLVQGIVNGAHRLRLEGDLRSVRAVRIYRPPGRPDPTQQRFAGQSGPK